MKDGKSMSSPAGHPVQANPGSVASPYAKPGPRFITPAVNEALDKHPEIAGKVRDVVQRKQVQLNATARPIMRTSPYMPRGAGKFAGSAKKDVPGPEIKGSGHGSGSPQRKY
jgi:hypothetical protein